ncbi:hypothetical protein KSD_02160 [Ktedonobacter sp. SOSP1-85]|nr:hypothetical protein KSD_02160 [Ktedonobacter sp. SOSP1-85]
MSTNLYRIEIVDVKPRAFTVRVTCLHPEMDFLPEGRTFACSCPGLDETVNWKWMVVEEVRKVWQRDKHMIRPLSVKP